MTDSITVWLRTPALISRVYLGDRTVTAMPEMIRAGSFWALEESSNIVLGLAIPSALAAAKNHFSNVEHENGCLHKTRPAHYL
jgi:hypothetical protein